MKTPSNSFRIKLSCAFILWMNGFLFAAPSFGNKSDTIKVQKFTKPHYLKSSYANESVELKNSQVQIQLFKRLNGWGWGEISTGSGKFMAVLEHLGEIMLRDQDIPMQLVAESVTKKHDSEGETLEFDVKSVVVHDVLRNTSFDNWMVYPYTEPAIVGKVSITLVPNTSLLKLKYRLKSTGNYNACYIRGPWLKVGESSFGTKKDDAVLPGIDWAIGDEWTSGTDFFKDPWALRVAPHPYKVTAPVMAISYEGTAIAMSWDPNQLATRWFNYRQHVQQPVFSSPNFIDRKNNQLMGLMVPDATIEGHENEVVAKIPLELKIGQMINFDADLWLTEGNSVSALTDWVKRHRLPEPTGPRWTYEETLRKIANAYNTNFWHEGEGFGLLQRPQDKARPNVPEFLQRYVEENKKTQLAKELKTKIDWCLSQKDIQKRQPKDDIDDLKSEGDRILSKQQADGSFPFHPDMVGKDDFMVATSFIEPMGLTGETALDITINPAIKLFDIGKKTGDKKYTDAARKAVDFCLNMQRPEAGDYWETPLHAANLLAAGHASLANYLAFQELGDQKYKEKAIYWMRTLLVFTHFWEPENVNNLYFTKPVLSSSDWYFANWVRDHVQWEVLSVFSVLSQRKISWTKVDPEIDWLKYQKGITNAAIQWMSIHTDQNWFPHNIPESYEAYQRGDFDYAFPDTHNSVTGNYGGMMIIPAPIAENIYGVIDNEKK
jgi:hypothetical protein